MGSQANNNTTTTTTTAGAESCTGGLDEDQDGLTDCADPDCGQAACGVPGALGTCASGQCAGGETFAACQNGFDDDRDGAADCEDADCQGTCACGGGSCAEACGDGVDGDGDGTVDEGCRCDFRGTGVGACAFGIIGTGAAAGCQPPLGFQAVESACDGQDNDCDGLVDEGCPCLFLGTPLGVCLGGAREADRCALRGGSYAADEDGLADPDACDGLDNDCDGVVDEGCDACDFRGQSRGICAFGVPGEGAGECHEPAGYAPDEDPATDPRLCDGQDNDCDGVADEGCSCDYLGLAMGVCAQAARDATGQCSAPGAFQQAESGCDGLDNDCDGEVDEGCTACGFDLPGVCASSSVDPGGACVPPESFEGGEGTLCDGPDNDCDGVTDEGCACDVQGIARGACEGAGVISALGRCEVPDGRLVPNLSFEGTNRSPELCADGVDNDCDGFADCDDEDCSGVGACPEFVLRERLTCRPGIDEDGDGLFGCSDPDCFRSERCVFGEVCSNGIDDDGDGLIDCADEGECDARFCGGESVNGGCLSAGDDDGDGLIGCDDPDCAGRLSCSDAECTNRVQCPGNGTETSCSNGLDDSGDGRIDCDDLQCDSDPACARGEFFCADGRDEDGDGLIDCDDPDCFSTLRCAQ